MPLPEQIIPDSKKNEEWYIKCGNAIARMAKGQVQHRMRDRFCYLLYHGVQNEKDFDYLRKVGQYEYPAKMRFIPFLRPMFEQILSKQAARTLIPTIYRVDNTAIREKKDRMATSIIDKFMDEVDSRSAEIWMMRQEVNHASSQIQAAMENGEQVPPEVQMKLQKAQFQVGQFERRLLNHEQILSSEISETQKYFKYEVKDLLEISAQSGLRYLIQHYDLESMFLRGFQDLLITDNSFYYVPDTLLGDDPVPRKLNPLHVYYPDDSAIQFVDEGEWVMFEEYMTLPQITDYLSTELKSGDLKKLETLKNGGIWNNGDDNYNYVGNSGLPTADPESFAYGNDPYSTNGTTHTAKMRVQFMFWKSPRILNFKQTPNPYLPDTPYTHFVKDEEPLNKGDKLIRKYVNDIHQTVRIGSDMWIGSRKRSFQNRDRRSFGRVQLPVFGYAYDNMTTRPYSKVWATKDIQITYNLIFYHMELWMALSGVKGFVMDMAQLPEGMSPEEWMYNRKQGLGWIDSQKEGVINSFNQFTSYDDTLTPAIQYLQSILQHLEDIAHKIVGVTPQAMGQINPNDQVRTHKASVERSELTLGLLYDKQRRLTKRVMDYLINLTRVAWKDGKRGTYVLGDLGQETFEITPNQMDSAQFETWWNDQQRDEVLLSDLKSAVAQGAGTPNSPVSLSQLVRVFRIDNLKEMEKSLEHYEDLMMQKQQASMEQQQKLQQQAAEAEIKLKKEVESIMSQKEQMDVAIKQAELKLKAEELRTKDATARHKIDTDAAVDITDIVTEERVEDKVLAHQERALKAETERDYTRMALDTVNSAVQQLHKDNQRGNKASDAQGK